MYIFTLLTTLSLLHTTASAATACNNSPSLCSTPYNNITHLGAHNSAFVRDETTDFSESGNHNFNSTVQLDAGVRLLTAQVHKANDSAGNTEWHLCHSSCSLLDAGTLTSWLSTIKTWMDANTNDVVTILLVNSDDASASDIGPAFTSSGIADYAYTPPSTSAAPTSWPTLETLIANNTRLVTFVASITADSTYPYLLDEFTFVFESAFENTSPADFSNCQPDRPSSLSGQPLEAINSGRMFLMNHFLYSTQIFGIETPDVTRLNVTNAETGTGSLGEQVKTCTTLYGKQPTFVLVDFFHVGPAIKSVDTANGVSDATGRKELTTALVEEATSSGGRERGSLGAVVVAVVVAVWFGGM
jgi:hypothetical protein